MIKNMLKVSLISIICLGLLTGCVATSENKAKNNEHRLVKINKIPFNAGHFAQNNYQHVQHSYSKRKWQTFTIKDNHAKFYNVLYNPKTALVTKIKPLDKKEMTMQTTGVVPTEYANTINYWRGTTQYQHKPNVGINSSSTETSYLTNHTPFIESESGSKRLTYQQLLQKQNIIPSYDNYDLHMKPPMYLSPNAYVDINYISPAYVQPILINQKKWALTTEFLINYWQTYAEKQNVGQRVLYYRNHYYFRTAIGGLYVKDSDLSMINYQYVIWYQPDEHRKTKLMGLVKHNFLVKSKANEWVINKKYLKIKGIKAYAKFDKINNGVVEDSLTDAYNIKEVGTISNKEFTY